MWPAARNVSRRRAAPRRTERRARAAPALQQVERILERVERFDGPPEPSSGACGCPARLALTAWSPSRRAGSASGRGRPGSEIGRGAALAQQRQSPAVVDVRVLRMTASRAPRRTESARCAHRRGRPGFMRSREAGGAR